MYARSVQRARMASKAAHIEINGRRVNAADPRAAESLRGVDYAWALVDEQPPNPMPTPFTAYYDWRIRYETLHDFDPAT
jgi:hypothetical protein